MPRSSNGHGPARDALHVAFVLDESGSMQRLASSVVSGFDEFVGELRADPGDTRFSLTLFDTRRRPVCVAIPVAEVTSLANIGYRPSGMTALFDAVAHTVQETDRRLDEAGKGEEKVMVVVMTDGLENSSTDYDTGMIANLIASYDERPNWTFVYLGAAHATLEEAQDAAAHLSFQRGNAMRWQAEVHSARRSMSSLAQATKSRRASSTMKTDALFREARQSEEDYTA